VLQGVPAAPGVAVAAAWVYRPADGGGDLVPLDRAAATAAQQLTALAERLRDAGRGDEAGILDAQAMMAEDPELLAAAGAHVAGGAADSAAILAAGEEQAALLVALHDQVLSARAADVRDVAERIARVVRGQELPVLERRSIAVARDLPPSITAELDPKLLAGIALESGSPTAHAAILARGLGIPAVVGVTGLLAAATPAGSLGIDGGRGEVAVDPDASVRARLEMAATTQHELDAADRRLVERPLVTRDGHRVMLAANIGRPEEAAAAVAAGAEGIGLFRTEFMFMGRASAPSVEEQVGAYASAIRAFDGRPVVIRLLDIGGDKRLPYLDQPNEENPFMGMRALRLAVANRELLVGQLRAILQAAGHAGTKAWIMAPMVADPDDVALFRAMLDEAGAATSGPDRPRVGIMVELPAAALVADQLAASVDFFSIGTNDLTQYLMAADRTNPALAPRQDPLHPAVLRAIRLVVEAGLGAGISVAVCGEMAGDPAGAIVLAGLGIDELSMDPHSFGPIKRAMAGITRAAAAEAASAACDATSAAEARARVAPLLDTREAGDE
jgi:phosphoenolpyruvate-protein phosphotransferase